MSEQLKEIAERHADRIGTYAVCTAPVELVMDAINEAIAADRAARAEPVAVVVPDFAVELVMRDGEKRVRMLLHKHYFEQGIPDILTEYLKDMYSQLAAPAPSQEPKQ